MKRLALLVVFFVFVLPACSIISKPCVSCLPGEICVAGRCVPITDPTPEPPAQCPEACPAGQECTDPAVGCIDKPAPPDPEPVCQPNQNCGCYVKPPGEDWKLLSCSAGQKCQDNVCVNEPTVPPTPEPTDCKPVLDPALSAPSNEDDNWIKAADQSTTSDFKNAVWSAVSAAKRACPAAWAGDCMRLGESGIDQGYLLISYELQKAGYAASQARTASEAYDHLYVRRSPSSSDWNATKLFYYGNGCLITGDGAFNVHGWYTFVGDDPTPPPVTPPDPGPVAGCSDPLPPKVWTAETLPDGWGSNEIGQPRWVLGCVPHNNIIDCTPKVEPRACEYCTAIGMGEMGGQPRCGCPVRSECPGFKCEERSACEAYLTGGTKLESRNGATCEFVHGNPFQFRPSNGNCRLCSVGDPRVCGGWF